VKARRRVGAALSRAPSAPVAVSSRRHPGGPAAPGPRLSIGGPRKRVCARIYSCASRACRCGDAAAQKQTVPARVRARARNLTTPRAILAPCARKHASFPQNTARANWNPEFHFNSQVTKLEICPKAQIRELLALPLIPVDAIKAANAKPEEPKTPEHPCPCCGSRMRIIETFLRGQQPKHRAMPLAPKIGIDTS
jgi:hypothetical protein